MPRSLRIRNKYPEDDRRKTFKYETVEQRLARKWGKTTTSSDHNETTETRSTAPVLCGKLKLSWLMQKIID